MKLLLLIIFLSLNLLSNQKSFKISYDSNYPPFSYTQDKEERGLLIDTWKLWAKYNDYKIEFIDGSLWDNAVVLAKNSKVDFFLGTNPYENWMIPSNSYYETQTSFFSRINSNPNLNSKNSLNIGIVGLDYKNFILKEFPKSNIYSFENYKYAVNALVNKEVDLIFDDKLGIEYFVVQSKQFHLLKRLEEFSYKKKIHAISADEKKIEIYNKGFLKIPIDELVQLEKKWISNEKEQYYPNYKHSIQLTHEERSFLQNNKLKVSISKSWEPFSFRSLNNKAIGISSEYWDLISKKLDIDYEEHFFKTFGKQLLAIENKESDLIYSTGETLEKKEYAVFSKEYLKFPLSIVTKKDENFIENISIIKDKKIAIGNSFTAYNILKKSYPDIKFILVDSVKEGLKLVSNNSAYAFVDIKPVLYYNILKYKFDDLKITGNTGHDFSLKFMIREDYKILESILNKAISSISANELSLIVNKWNNVQFHTDFNYDLFWIAVTFIILITLVFIFKNYLLHNHNEILKIKVDEKTKELYEINKNLEELVKIKSKELIQKENILNHQSKMAAMGEMLENIAHQWRQPLSVITTIATGTKLKKELDILSDEELYEALNNINNSSQYLSDTINDFRDFFNNNKETTLFNINAPIDKVLYILSSKLKNKNIQIIKSNVDLSVKSYENELIQVILNLLNNAIDALVKIDSSKKYIFIDIYKKNKTIFLSIKDNAGGIKDDILPRIFEPYFTTKHKSQGTGIGLYMSLEIINNHMNGNISASNENFRYKNEEYRGAKFTIEINDILNS